MDYLLYIAVWYLVSAVALFWILRLAVRYGVEDALERNRSWLRPRSPEDR